MEKDDKKYFEKFKEKINEKNDEKAMKLLEDIAKITNDTLKLVWQKIDDLPIDSYQKVQSMNMVLFAMNSIYKEGVETIFPKLIEKKINEMIE